MDSHYRSIAKAISYRALGSAVTILIVFVFSGDMRLSISAGLVDTLVKLAVYFAHERLWDRIPFGRQRPPEYEI